MDNTIHIKTTDKKRNGLPLYKVHKVGKNFSSGIKAGEHLTDTELDDFADMGGKIKHVKEGVDKKKSKKAKPDYLDFDGDGNKGESMKDALKQRNENTIELYDLLGMIGLTEAARGRPRKNPAPAAKASPADPADRNDEPDAYKPAGQDTRHIQSELLRVTDLHDTPKGGDHIEFANGKRFVTAKTATKAHKFLTSLKPHQRAQAAHLVYSDHKSMKHFE